MPLLKRGTVFVLVAACGASQAQWTATELDGFAARGIDGMAVVGESTSPYTALLWQLPNSPVLLHPAGASRSYAYDTHNGIQVGEVVWGALPHAALWEGDRQRNPRERSVIGNRPNDGLAVQQLPRHPIPLSRFHVAEQVRLISGQTQLGMER